MKRYIGVNKLGIVQMGGIDSSYSEYFTDQQVLVASGIGDIIPVVMGDVSLVCEAFKKTITEKGITDFNEISKYLYTTVMSYFGNYDNVDERLDYYNTLDDIDSDEDVSKVSELKGKNAAMCVERAMLTQNLLKTIGINSYFKSSGLEKDGKVEGHAYNLVEYSGKFYLVDTTIPKMKNGEITPVITELSKENFDKISCPAPKCGCSIKTHSYSVASKKELTLTYDPGREVMFDSTAIPEENIPEDDAR